MPKRIKKQEQWVPGALIDTTSISFTPGIMNGRPKNSRNLNACITISHSLHHFLSIIQTSRSRDDDSGPIDESRGHLSWTFGSGQEFESWWTKQVKSLDRKRRSLSTFDEMNDHLEYLESVCRTTAVQSSKEYEMKFICAQLAVKIITQGIFPVAPDAVVVGALDLLDFYLNGKEDHKFERIVAPQWDDPKPMTQETKKRIAKIEELGRSDPISVYRESLVTEPPVIGERARSPYQFVNVYAKEPKPRPKFADILETMRSKATCIDDPKYKSEVNGQKSQPPTQRNTDQSNGTSENIPSNSAVNPAALDELDNLNSESSFSYDDDVGDSELLTRIREAFTDNSEPIPTVPKTPERRRRSSSLAPNTPSPAKRNIEDEEPDPGQSSFTTSKEEDLAAMFLENPWFAFKKRNPKQVFLCNYDAECVPFKVVKGGKVLGEWVFALDMVYRKDALHQLLMATSLHANDPGNRMMETILQKFDREPEVVYKKKFVSRDGALRFTVKELWCDDEWKFNLEARVNFPRLLRMMETSRRVELESDSWLDWLDCSEKN